MLPLHPFYRQNIEAQTGPLNLQVEKSVFITQAGQLRELCLDHLIRKNSLPRACPIDGPCHCRDDL